MLNLPRQSFEKIKKVLLRQEKEVEEDLERIEKDDPVLSDGLAESLEPGTESWMAEVHTRATAMKENLQDLLLKTKKALANLNSGKYGKCENCGKPIEIERLEAIPTATLCMVCSKKVARS